MNNLKIKKQKILELSTLIVDFSEKFGVNYLEEFNRIFGKHNITSLFQLDIGAIEKLITIYGFFEK